MIRMTESGLTFGPYPKEACYKIEHSAGHLSLGNGFKMVEFGYFNREANTLFIVEAKSTIPNAKNDKAKFDRYFDHLYEKFENALLLIAMGKLNRNQIVANELPQDIASMNWQTVKPYLRLVIPDIPKTYLPQVTDKLRSRLFKIQKIWQINPLHIKVINQELAQKEGLIE